MSELDSPPASRPTRWLWLVVALFVAAVAGALVGWGLGGRPGTAAAPARPVEPLTQRGTVKPEVFATGVVYYPLPFASPPHLELKPPGRFVVVRQDEAGFTWANRTRFKDVADLAGRFPELAAAAPAAKDAKSDPAPDLEWEATGPRADHAGFPRSFEQKGTFEYRAMEEGAVWFPVPYATPPNVELDGLSGVLITDCTSLGFRWKGPLAGGLKGSGSATWTARGPRATLDDLKARPAVAAEPEIFRQTGQFSSKGNDAGEVYFAIPFAAPPNVEILFRNSRDELVLSSDVQVTECKADRFRWAERTSGAGRYYWVAKGQRVRAPAAGP